MLLTGAGGQLGRAVIRACPGGVELLARDRRALDLTDRDAVAAAVAAAQPDLVINCAGYTAVDAAESDPASAFAVNATGAGLLAAAAAQAGARLLHLSTDYVFDGNGQRPYRPDDPTDPRSVYGRSKRDGEREILARMHSGATIVRTAWLYAAHGRNFLRAMLDRMRQGQPLRVVADQHGTPTAAGSVARLLWALAGRADAPPILHGTDAGEATWYDFAVTIQQQALAAGLLHAAVAIEPITTADYPTPATRPRYSVLDCSATWALTGIAPPDWREALRGVVGEGLGIGDWGLGIRD